MDDFELELKVGFLNEAKELLANAEACFLNLERAQNDPSVIDQIFRLAHNLKGSASAVGFVSLKDFTHSLESLLLKIKNGQIPVNPMVIDLLLKSNDHLTRFLVRLAEDPNAPDDNNELRLQIEALIADPGLAQSATPAAHSDFADPHPTQQAQMSSPQTNAKAAPRALGEENIRVSLKRIDDLLNNVGELVILQTVLSEQRHAVASTLIQKTIGQMSKIVKEIQSTSMSLRMLPLKQTFQKMQRIVRDTSSALGKDVELEMSGEETELDKTVLEALSDPLVHLIRNAVDHGIESPEAREAAGKTRRGHIHLRAFNRGGQIIIEIHDDGKGLDAKRIFAKALEQGLVRENANMTEAQIHQLIFASGFSTKTEVTDISGRGVGMDVVKTNITHLQGDIELSTEVGRGTCIRIILPLTLAIVDGMVLSLGKERFVVPIAQITESLQPKPNEVSTIKEKGEVLDLRGEPLPLLRLENLLHRSTGRALAAHRGIALIVRDANQRSFAVLVDEIVCLQQVVIKRLGSEIHGLPGISGAAILGDGRAALILDLIELAHSAKKEAA